MQRLRRHAAQGGIPPPAAVTQYQQQTAGSTGNSSDSPGSSLQVAESMDEEEEAEEPGISDGRLRMKLRPDLLNNPAQLEKELYGLLQRHKTDQCVKGLNWYVDVSQEEIRLACIED